MNLVFLDIETSGLDPNYHEPIEVGYCWPGVSKSFSIPFDESRADPKALEVNEWGKRKFAPMYGHHQACEELKKYLSGAQVVANNVAFDLAFLSAFMRRNGYEPPWHHSGIDLKSLVAGRMGVSPALVSTSMIIRHFKLPNNRAHTALGDAVWNMQVYKALKLWEAE